MTAARVGNDYPNLLEFFLFFAVSWRCFDPFGISNDIISEDICTSALKSENSPLVRFFYREVRHSQTLSALSNSLVCSSSIAWRRPVYRKHLRWAMKLLLTQLRKGEMTAESNFSTSVKNSIQNFWKTMNRFDSDVKNCSWYPGHILAVCWLLLN